MQEKLVSLVTGKYKRYGKTFAFLAGGQAYAGTPSEKAIVKSVLSPKDYDIFCEKTRGLVSNHIYRESDKPNRHGHCRSNPFQD